VFFHNAIEEKEVEVIMEKPHLVLMKSLLGNVG
ncbi:hypothetical protein Tco_0673274, partial [Tanacetum coccineum]